MHLNTLSLSVASLLLVLGFPGHSAEDDAQRLAQLEQRLAALEASSSATAQGNAFNPAISLTLDGRFSHYENDADDYTLPGFALGGEAGLAEEGFSLGHSELAISANVDDRFYGRLTVALAEHDGETELEIEEAFVQTLRLGEGLTARVGRFFTSVGYHNEQHAHAWWFADAPLVYAGLWGNQYADDGLRLTWLAPTPWLLEIGAEALSGTRFPAGGENNGGLNTTVGFIRTGGDLGTEHSWQLGFSYFNDDNIAHREAGAHDHGGTVAEIPSFSGESDVRGMSAVYQWAKHGDIRNRFLRLEGELFIRNEDGNIELENSGPPVEESTLNSRQGGFYVQAIYQFVPRWRAGLRYDRLRFDSEGSDSAVLEEAGLLVDPDHTPQRRSAMLEWVPSEFSRIRVQYNRDESGADTDRQLVLQYTMSLGAHGAHAF